ncbi:MAG: hypothetical protein ACYSW8_27540, partial [Planctomycetota bacterium]
MDRPASSVLALAICVLFSVSLAAQSDEIAEAQQPTSPTITITRFEVDDQILELNWTIRNDTDHEVWICESINNTSPSVFEEFMDKDSRTLVLRRRFGVPGRLIPHERRNPAARYVRLRAGQERAESISIALPVTLGNLFLGEFGNAKYAERLVLEIGYYDENLPALILEIVELAEHLDINLGVGYHGFREHVYDRFFGGQWIARLFNSDLGFGQNVRSAEANGEMWMFHMGGVDIGEKVLQTEIDGVSIPYGTKSAESESPLVQEDAGVKAAITRLVVDDQSFEMGWKIINNTDHDVWICDSSSDLFMDTDNETLVIRMRYNISNEGEHWGFPFPRFRYSRLRPGEQKAMLIIRPVPVWPSYLFKVSDGNAEYARRVALEIGYYDEDLQALILDIVNMA